MNQYEIIRKWITTGKTKSESELTKFYKKVSGTVNAIIAAVPGLFFTAFFFYTAAFYFFKKVFG